MNKGFRIEKRRIGKAVVYMVLILLALYTLFPLLILAVSYTHLTLPTKA